MLVGYEVQCVGLLWVWYCVAWIAVLLLDVLPIVGLVLPGPSIKPSRPGPGWRALLQLETLEAFGFSTSRSLGFGEFPLNEAPTWG